MGSSAPKADAEMRDSNSPNRQRFGDLSVNAYQGPNVIGNAAEQDDNTSHLRQQVDKLEDTGTIGNAAEQDFSAGTGFATKDGVQGDGDDPEDQDPGIGRRKPRRNKTQPPFL